MFICYGMQQIEKTQEEFVDFCVKSGISQETSEKLKNKYHVSLEQIISEEKKYLLKEKITV